MRSCPPPPGPASSPARRRPIRGSYVLVMSLAKARCIETGRLGSISFPAGFYAYAGSALGGLAPRLERHLRREKKLHWHIDYLLEHAAVLRALYAAGSERKECALADSLSSKLAPVPGFGCSDCRCRSHLFFAESRAALGRAASASFRQAGMRPRSWHVQTIEGAE